MKKIINQFTNLNIAVIGDVMLDIFTYGISNRLSPEAPVPVVRFDKQRYCAGGAGNVVRNLNSLGIKSSIFGLIGNDKAADELNKILSESSINNFLICDPQRPTTVKERFISGTQQLLRVDHESTEKISPELENIVVESFKNFIAQEKINALIFSDYNKGVLSDSLMGKIINEAQKHNIITALDPKPNNLQIPQNLTILKPNQQEAFRLANVNDDLLATKEKRFTLLKKAAEIIYQKYNPKYLIISLSADGIAIFQDNDLIIMPTAAKEVFDVSGAGDTLISTLVASFASGATIEESTKLANIASGIVVSKLGTSTISAKELIAETENY